VEDPSALGFLQRKKRVARVLWIAGGDEAVEEAFVTKEILLMLVTHRRTVRRFVGFSSDRGRTIKSSTLTRYTRRRWTSTARWVSLSCA
jgi:hypothetical protein